MDFAARGVDAGSVEGEASKEKLRSVLPSQEMTWLVGKVRLSPQTVTVRVPSAFSVTTVLLLMP